MPRAARATSMPAQVCDRRTKEMAPQPRHQIALINRSSPAKPILRTEAHFFESMGGASSDGNHHALVLSLSDLSVWCYACASYVKHDRLLPLLVRAEAMYVYTYVD